MMNMKLASRSVLYAFAFILLGAMSVSAFAESTEYRRGYEQGYRDGLAAQNNQSRSKINIESARYGTRRASCNARDRLQRAVNRWQNSDGWNRRRAFSIEANDELCGDPAPNRDKQLDVTYRCGSGPVTRVQADEGDDIKLTCR